MVWALSSTRFGYDCGWARHGTGSVGRGVCVVRGARGAWCAWGVERAWERHVELLRAEVTSDNQATASSVSPVTH